MRENWKSIGSYGTLGLEIVLGVALPCYVGSLADKHYETGNTWLYVGFVIGVVHGIRAVQRVLKEANAQAEAEIEAEKEQRRQYYEDRKLSDRLRGSDDVVRRETRDGVGSKRD